MLDSDGRRTRERLEADVHTLAQEIGERHTHRPAALRAAAAFIEERLGGLGLVVGRQTYRADGVDCDNLYADVGEGAGGQLLVGAHYDSALGSPGGNDNASGVAVLLALAERFQQAPPDREVRLVFFTNEEPPHFRTRTMGSHVYAARADETGTLPAEAVVLDSVGLYSPEPGSQRFPSSGLERLFGDRGDFVAFVGNHGSEALLMRVGGAFRESRTLPSEGAAFRERLAGVTWSDHAFFWRYGVPAILVSDTATFRDDRYHTHRDRGDQVDYEALALLVAGLEAALRPPAD